MLLRLLVFGDIHSRLGMLEKLLKLAQGLKADAALVTGDLTNEATRSISKKIESAISSSFPRVFFVPGNEDSDEILGLFEGSGQSLQKRVGEFNGFSFIGIGGAKPVYCYYRRNLGELEAGKFLSENWPSGKPVVMLAHNPAFGTSLSKSSSGRDLGLQAFREAIEERQPLLFAHGHVHESAGCEKIGKTLCVNAGPVSEGSAALIDISADLGVKCEFLRF